MIIKEGKTLKRYTILIPHILTIFSKLCMFRCYLVLGYKAVITHFGVGRKMALDLEQLTSLVFDYFFLLPSYNI